MAYFVVVIVLAGVDLISVGLLRSWAVCYCVDWFARLVYVFELGVSAAG